MARICKVLIVENNDDVRDLLGDIFHDEGFRFAMVETGAEMHDALDEDDYDIVVIDVSQPDTRMVLPWPRLRAIRDAARSW
jgi:DNA-binding response OmpR family regulator